MKYQLPCILAHSCRESLDKRDHFVDSDQRSGVSQKRQLVRWPWSPLVSYVIWSSAKYSPNWSYCMPNLKCDVCGREGKFPDVWIFVSKRSNNQVLIRPYCTNGCQRVL